VLSYSTLPELPSSLLGLAKSYLFLKTQKKCWRWAFSVTPEFCASEDGLKLGEVLDTMDNTECWTLILTFTGWWHKTNNV